jgi:hypothetical protein
VSARDLLPTLIAAGLTIGLDADGVLLVGPRDRLTNDLRALVRSRRADLVAAVTADSGRPAALTTSPPDLVELHRLLVEVATLHGCTAKEQTEMKAAAERDPEGAAASFRATLASTWGLPDNRRTCRQCVRLARGLCMAARDGQIAASREYRPDPDLRRRCEAYMPFLSDPDQRHGAARWPGLVPMTSPKTLSDDHHE